MSSRRRKTARAMPCPRRAETAATIRPPRLRRKNWSRAGTRKSPRAPRRRRPATRMDSAAGSVCMRLQHLRVPGEAGKLRVVKILRRCSNSGGAGRVMRANSFCQDVLWVNLINDLTLQTPKFRVARMKTEADYLALHVSLSSLQSRELRVEHNDRNQRKSP